MNWFHASEARLLLAERRSSLARDLLQARRGHDLERAGQAGACV